MEGILETSGNYSKKEKEKEDESKDREIWTGWATLGFADRGTEGRAEQAADVTPASQS